MQTDIVFPSGNEEEFARFAVRLGYRSIIFAYTSLGAASSAHLPQISHLQTGRALFISSSQQDDAVNVIQRAQREHISTILHAQDHLFNRFFFEKTPITALTACEHIRKKDHLHFRSGGIDQILARLAAQHNKVFLTSILDLNEKKSRAQILGRIIFNILLCRKYHVSYVPVSFARTPYDMKGAHDVDSLVASLCGQMLSHTSLKQFFQ